MTRRQSIQPGKMQRSRANEKGRDFSTNGEGFIELQVSGGE
jgi:hypothetical protein